MKQTPKRQLTELEFMTQSEGWPRWPYLPIKHRELRSTAVLFEGGDKKFKWANGANLFALEKVEPDQWKDVELSELVRIGWVVD